MRKTEFFTEPPMEIVDEVEKKERLLRLVYFSKDSLKYVKVTTIKGVGMLFMLLNKAIFMKGSRKEETKQSKQGHVNVPRPDIRDEMDSRKEKEQGYRENDNRPDKKKKKGM